MSRRKSKIRGRKRKGFSLIELVIVVVIIAIIGAIAIPRMSRGAQGASDSALTGDLNVLRNAIDLYASEHNSNYPDLVSSTDPLTEFTDDAGNTSATKTGAYIYGPYLRSIPSLPVGPSTYKGTSTFMDATGSGTVGSAPGAWFYNKDTGAVQANLDSTVLDAAGNAYNGY